MNDVFISYEHESKNIADIICSNLENKKIKCWIAPRNVSGDYATSIVNAIEKTKIFVIILNVAASNSPHVLNEVEIAYKKLLDKNIYIIPFKIDNSSLSRAMEYYLKRLHWIDATTVDLDKAIEELRKNILSFLGIKGEKKHLINKRKLNTVPFKNSNISEIERLKLQQEIMNSFDNPFYNKVINSFNHIHLLDLGSNNGEFIMDRVGDNSKIETLTGIEYDEGNVKEANELFGSDRVKFFQANVEAKGFQDEIKHICEERKIDGFNIVNISMLLLHLQNPYQLLKTVRMHLKREE